MVRWTDELSNIRTHPSVEAVITLFSFHIPLMEEKRGNSIGDVMGFSLIWFRFRFGRAISISLVLSFFVVLWIVRSNVSLPGWLAGFAIIVGATSLWNQEFISFLVAVQYSVLVAVASSVLYSTVIVLLVELADGVPLWPVCGGFKEYTLYVRLHKDIGAPIVHPVLSE